MGFDSIYGHFHESIRFWNEEKSQVILMLLWEGSDRGCVTICSRGQDPNFAPQLGIHHPRRELFAKTEFKKPWRCPKIWGLSPEELRAFHRQDVEQGLQGASFPIPNTRDCEAFLSLICTIWDQ